MTESTRTLETLELVGGVLCLDFVNTINSRLEPEHDYLVQYSDMAEWAKKVEILPPAQSGKLQKRAEQHRTEAEGVIRKAQTFRELLYRLFSNTTKGSEPNKKDMETFIAFYAESISHGQFVKKDHAYATTWRVDEEFDSVLWPVIYSAGELLLSNELVHVKECPGCGWLFLDTSRNQSRRWCSMNTCGARDKMRRYHKKRRARE